MSSEEDIKLEYAFLSWAESIEDHQNYLYLATKRFTKILKSKHQKLSEEKKNEIATILGELHATIDSVSEMINEYLK